MTTPNYPHLAQRLFNTPLAITPGKIEVIMAALADRLGLARVMRPTGETVVLGDFDLAGESAAQERGYDVVEGVAIIPSRAPWCKSWARCTPTAA
jgi:hypothetical protein